MQLTLNSPAIGSTNWGANVNANWTAIQAACGSIQANQVISTTTVSTASTTLTSTGIGIALANPLRDTNSKVLIRVSLMASSSALSTPTFSLFRDSTNLTPSGMLGMAGATVANTGYCCCVSFSYLDSPGATVPSTYWLYYRSQAGTLSLAASTAPTIMIAEEIGG